MENKQRVVVVTGASSGIGEIVAKYFLQKGDKVFGLSRKIKEELEYEQISCDVTKVEQVKSAISQIIQKEGKIDVLINNAGMGISGSIENQKLEDIKKIFDVNFFGAVNVTQAVLPHMRDNGGGKIINTSSLAGFIPIPFQSFYSATKSSLDIWAKALRLETKQFNIDICNVVLGDTKTNFTSSRQKSPTDIGTVYEQVVDKSIKKMENDEQNGQNPLGVAKIMYKLSLKRKMPASKVVGFGYKTLSFLAKILPQKLMLYVVSKLYT